MRKVKRADQERGDKLKKELVPQQRLHATARISMAPIEERMGVAIRRARLERGLTLRDVASEASISVSMLSRFENGQSAAGLALLERICATLGTDLSTLLSEIEQKSEARLIKASDQREVVRSGGGIRYTCRLFSEQKRSRKVFKLFVVNIDKKSKDYPRFQHHGTEFLYMLGGRMQYRFENRTQLLEPGDAFTFSGNIPHGPETLLDDSIQFITIVIYAD
ncbi:XRE family transcriptional regulator [Bradyrhizobium sp. 141]|uniref:helix-turn-helix domain-containing protein n=1 Tax=Bradyrhizobium sp. 141 TaxID=2782617 RepID=UPI001FFADFA4|nr:XRE family transcriptional regulator [Bradyrhizobium sp. 141]MCK1722433.1 helix-turn-helix transcriptional regulator [Bradyrhizobium sp. 141]